MFHFLLSAQVFHKVLDVTDLHSLWKGNVVWTEM